MAHSITQALIICFVIVSCGNDAPRTTVRRKPIGSGSGSTTNTGGNTTTPSAKKVDPSIITLKINTLQRVPSTVKTALTEKLEEGLPTMSTGSMDERTPLRLVVSLPQEGQDKIYTLTILDGDHKNKVTDSIYLTENGLLESSLRLSLTLDATSTTSIIADVKLETASVGKEVEILFRALVDVKSSASVTMNASTTVAAGLLRHALAADITDLKMYQEIVTSLTSIESDELATIPSTIANGNDALKYSLSSLLEQIGGNIKTSLEAQLAKNTAIAGDTVTNYLKTMGF